MDWQLLLIKPRDLKKCYKFENSAYWASEDKICMKAKNDRRITLIFLIKKVVFFFLIV